MSPKATESFQINGCATCGHTLCAKKVSLFASLDEPHILEIISLIERKHYKKGDIVLRHGDLFDRLYIVNKGMLKAISLQEDGKEQILHLLSDGDSIGELALLKSQAAIYDIVAATDTYLCTIPKSRFDIFLKENPDLMFAILTSAYERISSLEKLVGAIASNDADVRLKFLIQQLYKQSGNQGDVLSLSLTREDMANFVGVTRETISRKLSQLSKDGVLAFIDQKKIRLLDFEYFDLDKTF